MILQNVNNRQKVFILVRAMIHHYKHFLYTYHQLCCHPEAVLFINLLKPTGHVMHHQFNIQLLYALPTLYLCVLYLSENKQRIVPLTA
jgi:hypothetical protein